MNNTDLPFPPLNLPDCDIRIRQSGGFHEVLDPVRRKFVRLSPEEWVRQHLIHFLVGSRGYPLHLIAVEYMLRVERLTKRCDVLAFGRKLNPLLIAEVKAPAVTIEESVLHQAINYNMRFHCPCILLSNGLKHYVFLRSSDSASYIPSGDIPSWTWLADTYT